MSVNNKIPKLTNKIYS